MNIYIQVPLIIFTVITMSFLIYLFLRIACLDGIGNAITGRTLPFRVLNYIQGEAFFCPLVHIQHWRHCKYILNKETNQMADMRFCYEYEHLTDEAKKVAAANNKGKLLTQFLYNKDGTIFHHSSTEDISDKYK